MSRLRRIGSPLVLLLAAAKLWAQDAPPQLVISSAVFDAAGETLTIKGEHFGNSPLVTLDLLPLPTQSASEAQIVAAMPAPLPPGTYLLTVSRGSVAAGSGSFDVVLKATDGADLSRGQQSAQGSAPSVSSEKAPGPPTGPGPQSSAPAAQVGDRVITVAEVDREWQRTDPARYATFSQQEYRIRRRITESLLIDELIAREAAARGLTAEELLKQELPKRAVELPEAMVASLYRELGAGARGATLEQMTPAIRSWLDRRTRPEIARLNYAYELMKTSTEARIFLEPPTVDVQRTAQDAALGPMRAPVELVAFGDFQSAEYGRTAQTFGKLVERFGNRIRIVFKNLPVRGQVAAINAAEAAQCAKAQGQFWKYHDWLLSHQSSLDAIHLKQYAADIGLNRRAFDACLDQGEFRPLIQQAMQEAGRYGIQSSPNFLVNGRLAPDPPPLVPPLEFLSRIIEEELMRQARNAPSDGR